MTKINKCDRGVDFFGEAPLSAFASVIREFGGGESEYCHSIPNIADTTEIN